MTELQQALAAEIGRFVAESPENRLALIDNSPIFEAPLVGFADGDDPLFAEYKRDGVVGPFHLTPREALAQAFGVEPSAHPRVGVVSWVLPVAAETVRSNAEMTEGPSLRWNHTRFHGEAFNDAVRRHVVAFLAARGLPADAPMIAPYFKSHALANGPASNWSERHIAYACGLGTFGLSDALITAKGVAHRCGSVVVAAEVETSPRPFTDPFADRHAYCRFFADGSCGICAERCPADAISASGHDKVKCRERLFVTHADWAKRPGYIGSYSPCGLCVSGVPCARGIPS